MAIIFRPPHRRYALHSVNDDTYLKFVNGYSMAKKFGVKGVLVLVSGSGVKDIVFEALKGEVKSYGKRRIATGIIAALTWAGCPIVPIMTKAKYIVLIANTTHTFISSVAECFEDCTNLAWLPLDIALCGQPIPIGISHRYNFMHGDSSLFDKIGD